MQSEVHIDFETRSQIDLIEVGTVRYATHPTTLVLCAYITWRNKRHMFNPAVNRDKTLALIKQIHKSNDTINAYNWTFEYYIMLYVCTRLYDWPVFKPKRFTCSLAASLRFCLPGKLESDTSFLKTAPKDSDGHRIMLRLTKPYKPTAKQKAAKPNWNVWFDQDPVKHRANQRYCIDDVKAETDLATVVPPLSKKEQRIFRIDQHMSTSGIHVDVNLCKGAIAIFEDYKKALLKRIPKRAWRQFETINQRGLILDYLNNIDKTLRLPNMQADTLDAAMRTCGNKEAKRIMLAYRSVGGQAVNKYRKALEQQYKGVLYCNIQYCGASGTGRWAGRGVQLHNMNRPVIKYDENAIALISSGNYKAVEKYARGLKTFDGKKVSVANVLTSYMRSFIVAKKGTYLAVNDFKAIEARLVFWCSDCKAGLKLFESGGDPYVTQASMIYKVKLKHVTGEQRFIGKQNILGCGYGMGADRFKEQCSEFGVSVVTGLAYKAINTYRNNYPEVVKYWRALEKTCMFLLRNNIKNKWTECGKVDFMYDGLNMQMRLHSGTILYYHKMTCKDETLYYYTTPTQGARKMMIRTIWGGTILQNICEAYGREAMADAMIRLDKLGHTNLLTVHDELINEVSSLNHMQEVQEAILQKASWAKGLPLEIEGEVVDRYRKI